jgi:hypothetical protein
VFSGQPKLIEVFAGTSWEVGLVKSLLENAEIQVYLKDDVRGSSAFTHFSPGFGGIKLMISSDDYLPAKAVIDEYYSNQKNNS